MASKTPLMLLARGRPASSILRQAAFAARRPSPATVALFHSTPTRAALPAGPPPPGFRLPRPERWDEKKNTLDHAAHYFLLLEMFRGMYVLLEQFFRPA
jgi:NADH dehydrogenase (ubiquinone) Fe-S protein 8